MTASDIMVVDLATEVRGLREQVAILEPFRELAQAAIEQLHAQRREIERLQLRQVQLIEQLRAARDSQVAA